jgi:hypothetical protein
VPCASRGHAGGVILATSQQGALLLLFVVAPLVVGVVVALLVSWRSPTVPPGHRTSELLAHGEPALGEVVTLRKLGSVLDVVPMVGVRLRITSGTAGSFEVGLTQAIPRRVLRDLHPGAVVNVRLAADRSTAAIVLV